jgi:hypothetical protein
MRTKLNCHKVLVGRSSRSGFIQALDVRKAKQDALREAREAIRDRLRSGFRNWSNVLSKRDLFDLVPAPQQAAELRPRFRMQGSMVYGTANEPAHVPPQHIDLDYGMYMPVSFITMKGQVRPLLASEGYFRSVELILGPLCEEKRWKLDGSKDSCIRIQLPFDSHIDLALYAIPDDQFATLIEKAAMLSANAVERQFFFESAELADSPYRELSSDSIMLAHRSHGWKPSDPRKLEDWFSAAVESHGDLLKRLCRYLKGWRDFQWRDGTLSSIAIMASVVTALDRLNGKLPAGRDDVSLLEVAKVLPQLLAAPIPNPIPGLPRLDEGWDYDDREEMVQVAEKLRDQIDAAINQTLHREIARGRLERAFGDRIPSDLSLIDIADEEAEILAHEPVRVSAPFVTRTTSG